jgi:hypothetical protein
MPEICCWQLDTPFLPNGVVTLEITTRAGPLLTKICDPTKLANLVKCAGCKIYLKPQWIKEVLKCRAIWGQIRLAALRG